MTTDDLFDALEGTLARAIDDLRQAKAGDAQSLDDARQMLERRRLELETLRDEHVDDDS